MARRKETTLLPHTDPYYIRFSESKDFDSERIWNFVINELEDQYKARPRDDDIFRFYLFVKQNKLVVLSQIRKEFAIKHPPMQCSSKSPVVLDDLSQRLANMPYPVMETVKKYHRLAKGQENKAHCKEIKLLAEIFEKGRNFGMSFVPSQIKELTRPRFGKKRLFRFLHQDPMIRLTLRAIEKMRERFFLTFGGVSVCVGCLSYACVRSLPFSLYVNSILRFRDHEGSPFLTKMHFVFGKHLWIPIPQKLVEKSHYLSPPKKVR